LGVQPSAAVSSLRLFRATFAPELFVPVQLPLLPALLPGRGKGSRTSHPALVA
jgi:hypothetical protein